MPEATNTLAGLVQMNDQNLDRIYPTDLLDRAPALAALFAKPASNGTVHKHLKQTTASSAAFRAINSGLSKTYSQDTLVTQTLKYLDASFHLDVALVSGALEDHLDLEAMRALRQMFFEMESQLWYGTGTGGDSNGFAGIGDNTDYDKINDATVYGAGGTSTNLQTSVYFLRSGNEDAAVVIGNGGVFDVSEPYLTTIATEASSGVISGYYDAYRVKMGGWGGLQIGSKYSVGRIANINPTDTTSAGAAIGRLDDDVLAEGLSLFPSDKMPNMICMNRASLKQLRNSRTATNVTGAPAPFPTEAFGIPIYVTDSILNTEAVVAAS